jgi:plastocyanin
VTTRALARGALVVAVVGILPGGSTGAPPRRAETGRLAGIVEISSALTARRPRFRIYGDAGPGSIPPSQQDSPANEMRNVVVYVESAEARDDGPPAGADGRADSLRHGVMAQDNERFEPHVLPVLQGARVDFPNRDDVYHNVFSLSSVRTFDLGRYSKGNSKAVTFGRAGIVQVFCHIHSDMSAIVFVLPNRFFATPTTTGRYTIDDLPPGEYTVVGWHERTRPVTQRVRIVAGQTATLNFNLPIESPTRR